MRSSRWMGPLISVINAIVKLKDTVIQVMSAWRSHMLAVMKLKDAVIQVNRCTHPAHERSHEPGGRALVREGRLRVRGRRLAEPDGFSVRQDHVDARARRSAVGARRGRGRYQVEVG